ncbi:MAG TPA: BrnT family toxin [Beijerinckiaceae bacterium]|nr:BrnT family toxin [Beijerinckiaceae bacterium]
MARAGEVFESPHVTIADDRKDYGEDRFLSVGFLDARMVFLAWTPRGAARRIISMRKANGREQEKYGHRLIQ